MKALELFYRDELV